MELCGNNSRAFTWVKIMKKTMKTTRTTRTTKTPP